MAFLVLPAAGELSGFSCESLSEPISASLEAHAKMLLGQSIADLLSVYDAADAMASPASTDACMR